MKAKIYLTMCLMIFLIGSCNSQTPEQKKMMEEIEKKAAEAQLVADSIMNTPEMKKLIEQGKEIEAAGKAEREKRLAKEKKSSKIQAATPLNTDYLKDFQISKGSAKKFDNWQFGSAELYVFKHLPFGKDPKTQYKVGSIGSDGNFDFAMPENINIENRISDFFKCPNVGSPPPKTEYSDSNILLGSRVVSVIQNGKRIGNISLATSRQQVYNFSPAHQFRGDPGYRLSWWYAEKESSANVICDRVYDNYGEKFEMRIIYNLEFKLGWNLIKTEVLEAHSPKFYKTQKHSIVTSTSSDAKWVFQEIRL